MSPMIGVVDLNLYAPSKRDLLLFDSIGAIELDHAIGGLPSRLAADIEWLASAGLIENARFGPEFVDPAIAPRLRPFSELIVRNHLISGVLRDISVNPSAQRELLSHASLAERLNALPKTVVPHPQHVLAEALATCQSLLVKVHGRAQLTQLSMAVLSDAQAQFVRAMALVWEATRHQPIVPLFQSTSAMNPALQTAQSNVLCAVLRALPLPDDDTPWEKILEFRSDEAAVRSLRRLQRWMSSLHGAEKSIVEIEDELLSMLDEYSEFMRIHELQSRPTSVEVVLVTLGEMIENLAKLRFGAAARALFEFRRREVALIEAERSAPGRQVAYIVAANHAFGDGLGA